MNYYYTKRSLGELYTAWIALGDVKKVKGIERIICTKFNAHLYMDLLTGALYPENNFERAQAGKPVLFDFLPLLSSIKDEEMKKLILDLDAIDRETACLLYFELNRKKDKKEQYTIRKCNILSNKDFSLEPSKYRREELEKLMIAIALNKKPVLITGPSGIGKTALVEELVYFKKQNYYLPEFLQKTQILELNLASLNNPKRDLENILSYIKTHKAILYVSGINNLDLSNDSILSLLMNEAKRSQAKIIISSNDPDYKKYQNSFEIIEIPELKEEQIKEIMMLKINELSEKDNISIKGIEHNLSEIITIIYTCSINNETINMTNNITNPGLSISIIEKAFAIAKVNNSVPLEIEHIIKAIETDKNINPSKKTNAVNLLQDLISEPLKPKLFFKKQKTQ